MNVLAINTSSYRLGVVILQSGTVTGIHETYVKKNQSTRAMPAIEKLMEDVQMKPTEIDKIVVAEGPGSFTGIRIGVTIAKTMAWALDVPIIGVSTLQALAYQAEQPTDLIVPFFDARRARVYTGAYMMKDGEITSVIKDQNIAMEEWLEQLNETNKTITFLSPDIEMYQAKIEELFRSRAVIPNKIYHRVNPLHVALAGETGSQKDVHTFEPEYLRIAEAEKKWLEEQEAMKRE